jgi:hypothetical protein
LRSGELRSERMASNRRPLRRPASSPAEASKVWVTYNSAKYLQERHGLPEELLQNIAMVETLAAKAGE